ncbi:hypothetical protein BJ170DRAFT_578563 [Xylariales sp. AK1849]|nr:hypothetical protein BJ170DRAFT_578563 [Xylariales sp. AK1849]
MNTPQRARQTGSKPCIFFQRGKCYRGTNCSYSHVSNGRWSQSSGHVNPQAIVSRTGGQDEVNEDGLREWKRLLRSGLNASRPTRETCNRFFQLALQLMDGDVGATQETVKLIGQDGGLSFIRDLAECHIPDASSIHMKVATWHGQVRPLFKLMVHHRVVDSAVLEQEVATIYSFIHGIGGRRLRVIFDFATAVLDVLPELPTSEEQESQLVAAELCLAVLAKLIDSTVTNTVDENIYPILQRLEAFIVASDNLPDEFAKIQARKYLCYIQRRLGVGEALSTGGAEKDVPVTRTKFLIRRDLPGRLSAEGQRHDNDHANICDISILPTQEEIASPRGEYLPTNDTALFHVPGIRGRLDREFRLLREDTVGQLRDAVRAQSEMMRNPVLDQSRRNNNMLRTYTYGNAEVREISFGRLTGIDLLVQIRQPAPGKNRQKRQDWWAQSKRLQPGSLVCVLADDGSALFCVVGDTTIITSDEKGKPGWQLVQDGMPQRPKDEPCLAAKTDFAYLHLHIADATHNSITQALRWYRNVGHCPRRSLIEFPGVLLPSFQHTLEALQGMSRKPNLPFTELIAPGELDSKSSEIRPPQYAAKQDFAFDLTCLTEDKTTLLCSPRDPLCPQKLSDNTTLDATQARALIDTLCRSLSMIQGPPGTGKSFTGEKLIKVLLANEERAKLGPILCVCYTNHALDQLLEHVYNDGVTQIIRLGSRSKSEILQSLNLRVVARTADRTKAERRSLREHEQAIDDHDMIINESLRELKGCQSQQAVQNYLSSHHPQHHAALFGKDADGFETVHRHPEQVIDQWRRGGRTSGPRPRQTNDLLNGPLWSMSQAERGCLYNSWLRSIRDPIVATIIRDHRSYLSSRGQRNKVGQEVDLRCLSEAAVIGVTTTGLARNLDLLQRLRCKVMLCEEAGEVLEAHTLTALLPSIEHAILIGDHLQLRPQIQNYELQSTNPRGAQFSLDVSLFERLVNPAHENDPKLLFSTLETQRRMHPTIAELIRSTLYPSLEDGGMVHGYPEVLGLRRRLFWLHHESPEDQAAQLDTNTTSHTNAFEAEMTTALVQHLVRQGSYGPDDIAVITPYLGQLQLLRRQMETMFEITMGEQDSEELDALNAAKHEEKTQSGLRSKVPIKTTLLKSIRLATVDNFQGEEAKVVVVSLVRSNEQDKCGFLSTPNRINVLLSRARHGMYLIGNSKTYGHVPMWAKVLKILHDHENVGTQLELQCARHPDACMLVSRADHFLQFAPEGGCMLRCDRRLSCGHSCINRCHSEVLHNAVKCLVPCPRPKSGCDHACRLSCGDACEPRCNELLPNLNLALPCGHKVSTALCWQAQKPSAIVCNVMVRRTVPGCNHTATVPCHTNVAAVNYKCQAICGDAQACGHTCRSSCYECKTRQEGVTVVNHGICQQPCGRKYTTCRHDCKKACHGDEQCQSCDSPCEVRCSHSKCNKQCHEPCAPCAEHTCTSTCPHAQCTMPCAAPCDWVPCSLRCQKLLDCGHQCPSLCGEACPDTRYCQVCCSEDIKATVVDFIMASQYQEIDLNDDPCIFPDCGHFLTKTSLDGVMDMKAHYKMSAGDNPTQIASTLQPFSMDEVKVCPTCRGSLRNIARYGRIVRRAMLDEATKKFIVWSNSEYLGLARRLLKIQQFLSESAASQGKQPDHSARNQPMAGTGRLKQLHIVRNFVGNDRYADALSLWHRISGFIGKVRKEEQPFGRVAYFVQHAARQQQTQHQFTFDETVIQVKGQLQGLALWLKCETVIFADFMRVLKGMNSSQHEIKLDVSKQLSDCETLIELARNSKHPRQEVEGHLYYAHFCTLARALTTGDTSDVRDQLKVNAITHVKATRELLKLYPSTRVLEPEVEGTEIMLRDSVFYAPVSAAEMKAVYQAMATEFRGTGHWYTCVNGHPFTIGECGMPMEQMRCPECGGFIGGTNHTAAEGVRHADEIEDLARGVGHMGI